jgi:hypothetical protein
MRQLSQLALLFTLLSGSAVLASRPVQEFKPPTEMSEEEKARLKAQQLGGNINAYGKDIQIKETPVPWAAIGLAGLVFLVATPFALRAYRDTSKEIANTNTFGTGAARDAEEES